MSVKAHALRTTATGLLHTSLLVPRPVHLPCGRRGGALHVVCSTSQPEKSTAGTDGQLSGSTQVAGVEVTPSPYEYHPGQFEARMDPSVLWLVVVPSERQTLGKAKRKGEVAQYLLKIENDESRGLERWFYTNWREQSWFTLVQKKDAKMKALQEGGRSQEGGLQGGGGSEGSEGSEVPPVEEYIDKMPDFWSLDNPIVFAGSGLVVIVALSAVFH
eukprot:gene14994-21052_t